MATGGANEPVESPVGLTDRLKDGPLKKELKLSIDSPWSGVDTGLRFGDSIRTMENVKTLEGGNSFIGLDGYTTADKDHSINKSIDHFHNSKKNESGVYQSDLLVVDEGKIEGMSGSERDSKVTLVESPVRSSGVVEAKGSEEKEAPTPTKLSVVRNERSPVRFFW
jgi:hypothetical protein